MDVAKQEIVLQIDLDSDSENEEEKIEKISFIYCGQNKQEIIQPGELFWGEFGKNRLWPCMISRSSETDQFLEKRDGKIFINVRFLNDYRFASLGKEKIFPFKGRKEFSDSDLKHRKINECPKAIRAADISEFLLSLKTNDRILLVKKLARINLNQKIIKYKKSKNQNRKTKTGKLLLDLIKHLIHLEEIAFVEGLVKKECTKNGKERLKHKSNATIRTKTMEPSITVKDELVRETRKSAIERSLETDVNQNTPFVECSLYSDKTMDEEQETNEISTDTASDNGPEQEFQGPPCKKTKTIGESEISTQDSKSPEPSTSKNASEEVDDESGKMESSSLETLNSSVSEPTERQEVTINEVLPNICHFVDPEASQDSGLGEATVFGNASIQYQTNIEFDNQFNLCQDENEFLIVPDHFFVASDVSLDSGLSPASELDKIPLDRANISQEEIDKLLNDDLMEPIDHNYHMVLPLPSNREPDLHYLTENLVANSAIAIDSSTLLLNSMEQNGDLLHEENSDRENNTENCNIDDISCENIETSDENNDQNFQNENRDIGDLSSENNNKKCHNDHLISESNNKNCNNDHLISENNIENVQNDNCHISIENSENNNENSENDKEIVHNDNKSHIHNLNGEILSADETGENICHVVECLDICAVSDKDDKIQVESNNNTIHENSEKSENLAINEVEFEKNRVKNKQELQSFKKSDENCLNNSQNKFNGSEKESAEIIRDDKIIADQGCENISENCNFDSENSKLVDKICEIDQKVGKASEECLGEEPQHNDHTNGQNEHENCQNDHTNGQNNQENCSNNDKINQNDNADLQTDSDNGQNNNDTVDNRNSQFKSDISENSDETCQNHHDTHNKEHKIDQEDNENETADIKDSTAEISEEITGIHNKKKGNCQSDNEKCKPQKRRSKIPKPVAKFDIVSLIDPANILDANLETPDKVRVTRKSFRRSDGDLKETSLENPPKIEDNLEKADDNFRRLQKSKEIAKDIPKTSENQESLDISGKQLEKTTKIAENSQNLQSPETTQRPRHIRHKRARFLRFSLRLKKLPMKSPKKVQNRLKTVAQTEKLTVKISLDLINIQKILNNPEICKKQEKFKMRHDNRKKQNQKLVKKRKLMLRKFRYNDSIYSLNSQMHNPTMARISARRNTTRESHQNQESNVQETLSASQETTESPQIEEHVENPEETLEELYVAVIDDEHFLYENATEHDICRVCHKFNGTLYKCQGFCNRFYHIECAGMTVNEVEEDTPVNYCCKTCLSKDFRCHICNQGIEENLEVLAHCSDDSCRLFYHHSCLHKWPKDVKVRKKFYCPQHFCHSCHSRQVKDIDEVIKDTWLVRCIYCPAAYHQNYNCTPAGSTVLTEKYLICPRHVKCEKKKFVKTQSKIYWCFYCHTGDGLLTGCEICPVSYHESCKPHYAGPENCGMCPECFSGKLPLYNEVVWGKYLSYRWWPCIIFPDDILYDCVLNKKVVSSSFAVRFFGTADYGFLTLDRVCEFKYESVSIPRISVGPTIYEKAVKQAVEVYSICKALKLNQQQVYEYSPRKLRIHSSTKPMDDRDEGYVCMCSEKDENPCGDSCLNRAVMFECINTLCNAGSKCQNQRFQKQSYSKVAVVETKMMGKGLVADEDIKKGSFIIEYSGEFIDEAEMNYRMMKKLENNDETYYFLYVDVNRYVDAEFNGNLSRFINHSCNPNCVTQKWTVRGESRMGIFAKQNIKKGTELTFHYKFDNFGSEEKKCFCMTENCNGFMTNKIKTGDLLESDELAAPVKQDENVIYGKNGKPKLKRGNRFIFRKLSQDASTGKIKKSNSTDSKESESSKFSRRSDRVQNDTIINERREVGVDLSLKFIKTEKFRSTPQRLKFEALENRKS